MTRGRQLAAALVIAAATAGCGAYGPPERAQAQAQPDAAAGEEPSGEEREKDEERKP